MKNRHLARALTAGITAAALSGLVALPAAQAAETVTIVDPDASPATRSLFSYLDDVRGEGILFGHQHTTSYGLTVTGAGRHQVRRQEHDRRLPGGLRLGHADPAGRRGPGLGEQHDRAEHRCPRRLHREGARARRHQHPVRAHGELRHRRQLLRHHGRHAARGPARRREERRPQRVPGQHRRRGGRRPRRRGRTSSRSSSGRGTRTRAPGSGGVPRSAPPASTRSSSATRSSTCATSRASPTSCTRSVRAAGSAGTPTRTCAPTPATSSSTSSASTRTTTPARPRSSTAWSRTSA